MSENYENSFYKLDYENAREAFSKWQSKQHETIDEYLMRKRKIELISLVKEVIENELIQTDKDIVRLHWYLGKSITETAEIIGSNRSSVSRRLDKINDIIYEKLKYALHYRYGKDFSASAKLIIKNKDALCIFQEKEETVAQRIKLLRIRQGMTIRDSKEMTGISISRLEAIENNRCQPTAEDIKLIATAYKTSGDYIIFGKKKGDFANGFIN
jgi:DNA-binding transcriptional regulator YiaG